MKTSDFILQPIEKLINWPSKFHTRNRLETSNRALYLWKWKIQPVQTDIASISKNIRLELPVISTTNCSFDGITNIGVAPVQTPTTELVFHNCLRNNFLAEWGTDYSPMRWCPEEIIRIPEEILLGQIFMEKLIWEFQFRYFFGCRNVQGGWKFDISYKLLLNLTWIFVPESCEN